MDIVDRINFLIEEEDLDESDVPISSPGTTTADIAKVPEKNVLGLRKKRKKRMGLVKVSGHLAVSPL